MASTLNCCQAAPDVVSIEMDHRLHRAASSWHTDQQTKRQNYNICLRHRGKSGGMEWTAEKIHAVLDGRFVSCRPRTRRPSQKKHPTDSSIPLSSQADLLQVYFVYLSGITRGIKKTFWIVLIKPSDCCKFCLRNQEVFRQDPKRTVSESKIAAISGRQVFRVMMQSRKSQSAQQVHQCLHLLQCSPSTQMSSASLQQTQPCPTTAD